jgi:hypothetical protein
VTRPIDLLRESVRIARHSVVIKDHLVDGWLARPTLRLMDVVGNAPHGVAVVFNYFTPTEWRKVSREAGLVPLEVRRTLRLYPSLVDAVLGRSLHFVGLYEIDRDTPP